MKPTFLAALISQCHVIETAPLGEVRQYQPITFFVYRRLRDVIHLSPQRYVHEFRALAVPTHPLQMKHFIL